MTDQREPKLERASQKVSLRSHSHSDSHAHEHGHSHDHDHPHAHDHDFPEPVASSNPSIAAGAAERLVLFLDAPSGLAGDMTIAALVDLGVPFAVVEDAAKQLPLSGYRLALRAARSGAIGGSRFVVEVTERQPERRYAEIDALIADSALATPVKELSRRIFRRLAEAESEVHRIPISDVAFHEVGAVDAIIDIVGAAACIAHLGARVIGSPLPLGRGFVRCQHGLLPLPAPATLLCLRGVPTYDAQIESELVTPTGAAIIASVAEEFMNWPSIAPERVGWGCGTRVLPDRVNALRAVLGRPLTATRGATHVLLEANVDDMTGELAAFAIDALLGAGALDAWAAPVTMKKGRPGLVMCAIAERAKADELARVMLRETTSIGVRSSELSRTERPRRLIEVETQFGRVPLKISEGDFGPALAKPEFDACAALARAAGVPVREVLSAALAAYQQRSVGSI